MKNIAHMNMSATQKQAILQAVEDIETAAAGQLAALTEAERVKYGSVNEQNKLLVNKVRDYNQNSPSMSAPEVDWTEYESDYQARLFYENLIQRLQSIVYQMQSTKILHDYDNYQDALADYAYAQYKKGAGEPGFAEKVAEIKQFFPKSGKNQPPPTDENP